MSTLLHIDSSPLYGRSVSRELTSAFVRKWKAAHTDGVSIERDLYTTTIPPVTSEWVGAAYTPRETRTIQQNDILSLSDTLLAELERADEYVFGVPMHNFGLPSVLKLWVDQICRVGRTFAYELVELAFPVGVRGCAEGLIRCLGNCFGVPSGSGEAFGTLNRASGALLPETFGGLLREQPG